MILMRFKSVFAVTDSEWFEMLRCFERAGTVRRYWQVLR